jgi:membrane fusion protein, multidrug efflux system
MKQDLAPARTVPSTYNEDGKPYRDPERKRKPRVWIWLLLLVVFGSALFLLIKHRSMASARSAKAKSGNAPMPVVVDDVTKGDMPVYITGLGTVTPLYTVTVKTRVDGQLMQVLYREGQTVRQGDALAEIDPRPFQVQLAQAEGQLAKDQAALQNAKTDLARYQTLLKRNAVAQQIVVTQEATVAQDAAVVKTDEANVASAKLNIFYCHITAPITGRVGLRLVDPGNFVNASSGTALAVITQMQPISVLFTVPEQQVGIVLDHARRGTLSVDAFDREMKTSLANGELKTTDNQIDPSTGTLKMRAVYPNKDERLFPNQFVNARLLVETHRGVPLVPNVAIQRNTTNTFVYLLKPDKTVTVRNISVGADDSAHTEVTSGLNPGDVVVTQGVDRLSEGAKVTPAHPGQNAQTERAGANGNQRGNQGELGRKRGKSKQ